MSGLGARSLAIRWLEQGRPDLAVREFKRAICSHVPSSWIAILIPGWRNSGQSCTSTME